MPPAPALIAEAISALRGPAVDAREVDADHSARPGLYALHASARTWTCLGLGSPPDARPLYVGKSESTLAKRDIQGHFGLCARGKQSPTGSSTVRRSFAALLAEKRGYRGMPRNPAKPSHFSNFGLSVEHDDDLSAWMLVHVRLALWPHDEVGALDTIETHVLRETLPPLNLSKIQTPWLGQVKTARGLLKLEAEAWRPR